jgi:protein kinase-like protein
MMRTREGRLKILDFGLARVSGPIEAAPYATQPGMLVGTPAYMAPEQINGGPVGARADVFAFGVTLYEYACGTHPFAASTALATVARVLESDARPLVGRAPEVPSGVADIIARCLRKAPEDRLGSAAEIVGALDAVSDARANATPRTGWWRTDQIVVAILYIMGQRQGDDGTQRADAGDEGCIDKQQASRHQIQQLRRARCPAALERLIRSVNTRCPRFRVFVVCI